MRSTAIVAGMAAICLGAVVGLKAASPQEQPQPASTLTFSKDVAPILFKNCTHCHRPGEVAPMSLLTYKDARPWAKAIHAAVLTGVMPPWHADPAHGEFANDRRLSEADKNTIAAWVSAGAPEGNPADVPSPPKYIDGWQIGEPDIVFEMTEDYAVPAKGVVEYEWMYIPTNFAKPTYVQALEIRPGNRKLVHHVLAYYRAKPDAQRVPVLLFDTERQRPPVPSASGLRPRRTDPTPARLIATYAPGTLPQVFPPGTALRLEAGGVLELQMHYSTNGTAGTDRTKVGMILSKDPAPAEVLANHFFNAKLRLPARATTCAWMQMSPFSRTRRYGACFLIRICAGRSGSIGWCLPDGTERMILSVPRYDFNWQTYYMFREPLRVPKGSRIVSSAWYDNSARNRSNPDPNVDVSWGDQTWEEMQYTGLLYSAGDRGAWLWRQGVRGQLQCLLAFLCSGTQAFAREAPCVLLTVFHVET